MMDSIKYIFFSNGQKGGVATFINDHMNYLSQTKKNLLLIKKNLRENAIKHDLFNSKKFSKDLADKLNDIWKDYAIE